jgi:hypothetical protein
MVKTFGRFVATWLVIGAAACGGGSGGSDPGGPADPGAPGEDVATVDPGAEDALPPDDRGGADVPAADACVPDCAGRDCGDDGCGGSCGPCEGGTCLEGTCCMPSCGERKCGDNGCGGTCGTCLFGAECVDGACVVPCPELAFTPVRTVASWKPIHGPTDPRGEFFYQDVTSEDFPMSSLRLEIRQYKGYDGPLGPGTYPFQTDSYMDCEICVSLFDDCTTEKCARRMLATEGTLEISALSGPDGAFAGVLRDVHFREAYIGSDWKTTLASGRPLACLPEYALSADDVRLAVPEPACVTEGTGDLLDDNIADFELTNCNGEKRRLHDLCGQTRAMWIVLVTIWCPACSEFVPMAEEIRADNADALDLWVVIGEDKNGGAPDQAECLAYAQAKGVDPSRVFFDPNWDTVMANIYPYGFQGIPYSITLDGDNMAFYWCDGSYGSLGTALDYLME